MKELIGPFLCCNETTEIVNLSNGDTKAVNDLSFSAGRLVAAMILLGAGGAIGAFVL